MKSSIQLLNDIIETIGDDWKKSLDTYLKGEEDETDVEGVAQYSNLFSDFVNAYKEDVIDNATSVLQQIEKNINNDLLFNNLQNHVKKLLRAYNAINSLRVLEVQDYKKATRLVDFIFEQVIIRYDSNADESYTEFGLETEEEFRLISGVLDSLCTFIVSQNFHRKAMAEIIRFNTRLSRDISEYISDIIDQNFESLKTKIILEKIFPSA